LILAGSVGELALFAKNSEIVRMHGSTRIPAAVQRANERRVEKETREILLPVSQSSYAEVGFRWRFVERGQGVRDLWTVTWIRG